MKRHKHLLSASWICSLLVHGFILGFLQQHSMWLYSNAPIKEEDRWLSHMAKHEKTRILKQSFARGKEDSSLQKQSLPHPEQLSVEFQNNSSVSLNGPTPSLLFFTSQLNLEKILISSNHSSFNFTLPQEQPINLLSHLPRDLIVPQINDIPPLRFNSPIFEIEKSDLLANSTPELPPPEASIDPLSLPPQIQTISTLEKNFSPSPIEAPSFPSLPTLPTLEQLSTVSYSAEFEADLVFVPNPQGEGYLFALTLIARPDLHLSRLHQHVLFLIDRSNSIQKDRLENTKNSVLKALEELHPDDTFNIITFDNKLDKLTPSEYPVNSTSIEKSQEFLSNISLGSFFSPADLYRPLLLSVPSQVKENEIYTVILLTDGETLGKKHIQRSLLDQWTSYNQGKVSLYIVCMEHDPQIPSLDALSAFNRGKLITSNTKRGYKRKLLKTVRNLQQPVAKSISCRAIATAKEAKIELFPSPSQSPDLYLSQPFVILGKTDSLEDFVLFIQGRIKDRWLNIKKTISFASAKKGSHSLKSEWALQESYQLYKKYLLDHDAQHLADAEALLKSYQLRSAF